MMRVRAAAAAIDAAGNISTAMRISLTSARL